jgi:hypothetical protein
MNSDVEVTVTGLPFNQKAISGVSISYGYNSIPVASVQLVAPYIEEEARSFLCDPDSFKKQTRDSPVKISIKSKTGCINFDGVFDGMSFCQTPGGLSYSAIFKSKFQSMLELYPKWIGIDPGSILPFKRVINSQFQSSNSGEEPYLAFKTELGNLMPAGGDNMMQFLVKMLKALVTSQKNVTNGTNTTEKVLPILGLMDGPRYKDNVDRCLAFLELVDLSNVSKIDVMASQNGGYVVDSVLSSTDTLWETLSNSLNQFGAMLLPANNKLFIVPKANFLKMSNLSVPGPQDQSTTPNVAYPSDFVSFVINDTSYKNIYGCYVVPTFLDAHATTQSYSANYVGSYPNIVSGASDNPDDGSSGLLIVNAPQFIIHNFDSIYAANEKVQNEMAQNFAGDKVDAPEQVKDKYAQIAKTQAGQSRSIQETLDKYAKSRFLQEKYSERGGSLTLNVIKPNWVPGTTGSVYTRHPGLFYSFFVNTVTHSVSLGAGNSGSAVTQISFNSCRYAGNPGKIPGTNSVDLYSYSSGDMESLQHAWLSDVAGTAVEDIQ